jgi:hypothetical protein
VTEDRGQLVLLAAVAVTVALVSMLLAFMQLGYQPGVAGPQPDHLRDVERTLERELVAAAANASVTDWGDSDEAVSTVRSELRPTLASLNRSALDRNTLVQVTYNASRAGSWRGQHCPSGPARRFGPCAADRGVVVQERAGETHVLAIAVDVRIIGDDSRLVARTIIEHP